MPHQITSDEAALRLFFTDDIYIVEENITSAVITPAGDVNEEVKAVEPIAKPAHEFKFLGSNGRKILILVYDEENDVSDEKGRELLRKIVKSIGLTASDFALLNYAKHQQATFADLMSFFASNLVFAFGVKPLHLGLGNHSSNLVVNEGDVRLVFSHELRLLDQDTETKKALWAILQKLPI